MVIQRNEAIGQGILIQLFNWLKIKNFPFQIILNDYNNTIKHYMNHEKTLYRITYWSIIDNKTI